MNIQLRTGGNFIVYTGTVQSADAAFASILSYLHPTEPIYYWNNVANAYEEVLISTQMVPYGCYWVEVIQDCTWSFGADSLAPTSVQLYGPIIGWNYVPYMGLAVSVQEAFSGINVYLVNYYYFDNIAGEWLQPVTMVPGAVYAVDVTQNVVWQYAITPPSAYVGSISKKELEYDSSRADIPATDTPIGNDGLVHIWARNDTDSAQRMGINWFILDPDNITIEHYTTWEAWPYTGAGGDHEFIGGRFDISKAGTYYMLVEILMNHDSPEVVAQYWGILCTVLPSQAITNLAVSTFSRE